MQPRITRLILNENEISSALNFNVSNSLRVLELRKNKLTSCSILSGLNYLEELYLAENEIADL